MSKTKIPESVKLRLWGVAAGRCQYEDCNEPLFYDELTKAEFNSAYVAHIYADSVGGPRYDPVFSPLLKKDLSNLMLMCDRHHRLIDREQVAEHPVERLKAMKARHEERISIVTAITVEKQSHIVLFGANIGQEKVPLSYRDAAKAMLPRRYPASGKAIELGIKNLSFEDHSPGYWFFQEKQLNDMFREHILPLKGIHPVQHFSIFGLAPMPLLVKFGTLLSDIFDADVYQRHREPATWEWQAGNQADLFIIKPPQQIVGVPVLKISLSAQISEDRISQVMDQPHSVWEITVLEPGNDLLRSPELLCQFRQVCRQLYDQIKVRHGQQAELHVFPAMPVSAAIEFGRVRMPKADLPMIIYDQNKVSNSFVPTIKII
ncbi:SAVED domain-containing protein [Mucilaginibacter sp. OK098]|uniref:SAVED domain-containing protein n=1 Tax=Mucilaginibacter sp. OK098 TaxID=1855297 RepID=UPI00093375A7|nr:SAVED domain-containing protein [Mucilaginibacter sp. OK098]